MVMSILYTRSDGPKLSVPVPVIVGLPLYDIYTGVRTIHKISTRRLADILFHSLGAKDPKKVFSVMS